MLPRKEALLSCARVERMWPTSIHDRHTTNKNTRDAWYRESKSWRRKDAPDSNFSIWHTIDDSTVISRFLNTSCWWHTRYLVKPNETIVEIQRRIHLPWYRHCNCHIGIECRLIVPSRHLNHLHRYYILVRSLLVVVARHRTCIQPRLAVPASKTEVAILNLSACQKQRCRIKSKKLTLRWRSFNVEPRVFHRLRCEFEANWKDKPTMPLDNM